MTSWRWRDCLKTGSVGSLLLAFVAGTAVLVAPVSTESAVANGDTRTIHLLHAHTHETIDATYMVDGQYDPAVLEKLNWFLRDFRRNEEIHMDPKLFDVVWEVYRESGSHQPVVVMSAYRSPETNAMLRRRSRAVAEHSQHILGKAMDQHYVDVPMSRIREIAMRLQRGGVGFYPTVGTPFVHMDVGGVRHWPRMSYDQLARLFPDGKTVHIPSNGQPLPGYELARAELEARGDSFNYPTAGEVQSKSKGFFAWLFGGGDDEGDEGEAGHGRESAGSRVASAADRAPVGSVQAPVMSLSSHDDGVHSFLADASATASPAPTPASPVTLPTAKGRRGRVQVASLEAAPPPSPEAQQKLADEMRRQQAEAEAKQKAAEEAAAVRQAAAPPPPAFDPTGNGPAATESASSPLLAPPVETALPVAVPLPPRRPTEIASAGPEAPLPPDRPSELGVPSDRAPTPPTRLAAISPATRAALPPAITGGGAGPVGTALAFTGLGAEPPLRPTVPVPVPRPVFVPARLDRSNFASLTSATLGRSGGRSALGSSVTALRPAARATLAALSAAAAQGAAQGFGQRATDLSVDHFSGKAVRPAERVTTANGRRPRASDSEVN